MPTNGVRLTVFRLCMPLLVMGCVLACTQPTPAPPAGPNLIVISLDTVRADHTSVHGYHRDTTPHLNALAKQGIAFKNAQTSSPWTLPAHASLHTGLYPTRHGVHHHDLQLADEHRTLAEHLQTAGFTTAAFVNSGYLKPRSGLHQGFQTYQHVREVESSPQPTPAWTLASNWLRANHDKRFFLFLHIYDAHSAFRALKPSAGRYTDTAYSGTMNGGTAQLKSIRTGDIEMHPPDIQHLIDRYDENLHQTDAKLGEFIATLKTLQQFENTVLIVTSDHGEALGEHGEVLHGRTHFQQLTHIPWVSVGPGLANNHTIDTPVSIVDLAPTAAAWVGHPFSHMTDGLSLHDSTPNHRPIFIEADQNGTHHNALRSVRRGDWKLTRNLQTLSETLVHLPSDANEQHNRLGQPDTPLPLLRTVLNEHLRVEADAPSSAPLSDAERNALIELGYLAEPKR